MFSTSLDDLVRPCLKCPVAQHTVLLIDLMGPGASAEICTWNKPLEQWEKPREAGWLSAGTAFLLQDLLLPILAFLLHTLRAVDSISLLIIPHANV